MRFGLPDLKPEKAILSESEQKYFDNSLRAMRDHGMDPDTLPDFSPMTHQMPLVIEFGSSSKIGLRPTMEDAHFHCGIKR